MTITLQLDEDEYQRLKAEADRRGLLPEALVRTFVQKELPADKLTPEQIRKGREALAWLREFGKRLPIADISPYIEASREELEQRTEHWLKSSTETS